MDVYRTEEEQIEAIKKWWNENGKSVVAGIVIGFVALFGWRGWQSHQTTEALAASDIYQQMVIARRENKSETAQKQAKIILEQYKSTAYAHYAALLLAKYAAENNDFAAAKEKMNWVIANTSQDQIQHIARLRLARILTAEGQLGEAQKLLNSSKPGKFAASYDEMKGDIFSLQGNTEAARVAYLKAQAKVEKIDPIMGMKLEDLGR